MARRRASGRAVPLSDPELDEFARVAQRMWAVGSRSLSYRGYVGMSRTAHHHGHDTPLPHLLQKQVLLLSKQ